MNQQMLKLLRPGQALTLKLIVGLALLMFMHSAVAEQPAAQEVDWFYLVMALFGGLAMFLYGMDLVGGNLQKVAGDKLRAFLERISSNRVVGCLTGALVTAVLTSLGLAEQLPVHLGSDEVAATAASAGIATTLVLILLTTLQVVLGALVPKSIGIQSHHRRRCDRPFLRGPRRGRGQNDDVMSRLRRPAPARDAGTQGPGRKAFGRPRQQVATRLDVHQRREAAEMLAQSAGSQSGQRLDRRPLLGALLGK